MQSWSYFSALWVCQIHTASIARDVKVFKAAILPWTENLDAGHRMHFGGWKLCNRQEGPKTQSVDAKFPRWNFFTYLWFCLHFGCMCPWKCLIKCLWQMARFNFVNLMRYCISNSRPLCSGQLCVMHFEWFTLCDALWPLFPISFLIFHQWQIALQCVTSLSNCKSKNQILFGNWSHLSNLSWWCLNCNTDYQWIQIWFESGWQWFQSFRF